MFTLIPEKLQDKFYTEITFKINKEELYAVDMPLMDFIKARLSHNGFDLSQPILQRMDDQTMMLVYTQLRLKNKEELLQQEVLPRLKNAWNWLKNN